MKETLNVGILGSTNGTDLPAIVKSINEGELRGLARIAAVISNREGVGILEKADHYNLNGIYLNPKNERGKLKKRETYDREIAEILEAHKVGLTVCIGYMKLFSAWMIDEYRNRIMNIHPSLLPSFPGMDLDVHQEVLDYGCKVSGCTLFYVDEGKDTGPIILQKAVPVLESDNAETLKLRVQNAEQEILPQGIVLYAQDRLSVEGRKVNILPNREGGL